MAAPPELAEGEPEAEPLPALQPSASPRLGAKLARAALGGGADNTMAHRQSLRQSTGFSKSSRASADSGSYRPPMWSRQFGNPHGQWSTGDSLKILGSGHTNVTNSELVHVEKMLREYIFSRIDPFTVAGYDDVSRSWSGTSPKHHAQLAPEGRQFLRRLLEKAAGGDDRISIKDFQKCLGPKPSEEALKCLSVSQSYDSRGRKLAGIRSSVATPLGFGEDQGLTKDKCTALFMKFGHDEKGRLPIDVFVRRLFSGEAHVLSLEGIRVGAFDQDHIPATSTRSYTDFQYKWQGMIKKAPRFCKTGFFAPSDWEDYATHVCRRSGSPPEAYLKLEHVHGFNGLYNTTTNLFYARRGVTDLDECLVYYAAAVGVVYKHYTATGQEGSEDAGSERKKQQKFFTRHNDDITSIAMHPFRKTVATGQQKSTGVGNKPTVFIWDAFTRRRPLIPGTSPGFEADEPIKLEFASNDRAIGCLAFSPEGDKLLTISRDDAHTARVWDWRAGRCLCDEAGMRGVPPQVFGSLWNPFRSDTSPSHFITFGKKHILFWNFAENADSTCRISFKPGVFGDAEIQDVLCACYLPSGHILTGGPNGSITVFRKVTDSDADADFAQENLHQKTPSHPELQNLRQRRSLKTVAVQEILHAHGPGVQLSPDEDSHTGQWGWNIKNGGCTVLKLSGSNKATATVEDAFTVFSGGGDGRIVQWSISAMQLTGITNNAFKTKPYDVQNKIDNAPHVPLTPVRVFDARLKDPSGPPRMFIAMDTCNFGEDGLTRKICVGDTENDIWEIVETRTQQTLPFEGGDLEFISEGQSDQVHGIAPYPLDDDAATRKQNPRPYATACENGNIYIWDTNTKSTIAQFEIRRDGNMGTKGDPAQGGHAPRGCKVGELLRAKACAFDHTGTRLAVSTCGVRQLAETIIIKIPEGVEGSEVHIHFQRSRRGGVIADTVNVTQQAEPATEPAAESAEMDGTVQHSFAFTLPKGTKPHQELAIDVPSSKEHPGYGQYIQASAKEEDRGGVVLVYEFEKAYTFDAPKKIYERKLSLEAIDQVKFSPDGNMLAAGSHDNNIYVLSVPAPNTTASSANKHFEPIGVCGCHSSYVTALDWSASEGDQQSILQSTCGAYEVLYYRPESRKDERDRANYTMIWDDTMWPVCPQVQHCQRDRKWHSWCVASPCGGLDPAPTHKFANVPIRRTCTLGFPVMGMWSELMDGTDINACDRAPFVAGTQLASPPQSIHHLRESFSDAHSDFAKSLEQTYKNSEDGKITKAELTLAVEATKSQVGLDDAEIKELVGYFDADGDETIPIGDVVTRLKQNYPSSFLVSARDDGQVHLHHYPSVIHRAPGHGFTGHSSHVANIKFTLDGEHVISAGGMDRTTFQWKTHGVVKSSSQFQKQRDARSKKAGGWGNVMSRSRAVSIAASMGTSKGGSGVAGARTKQAKPKRTDTAAVRNSRDPHVMAQKLAIQDAQLQLKQQEIEKLKADIDALQRSSRANAIRQNM